MFDKLKQAFSEHKSNSFPSSLDSQISKNLIYQTRQFHGVNFGGLFLLEKWLAPSLFPEETNGTEYELNSIKEIVSKRGVQETANLLASHFQNYLQGEDEFKWLKEHGIDSVRIPVGYWHVSGGSENYNLKGTKFEQVKEVYKEYDPLDKLKQVVEKLQEYGIGCIIDIHGLPGSANGQAHNGEEKDNNDGGFFGKHFEKHKSYIVNNCLPVIVNTFENFDNIIGLQVINENEFVSKDDDPKKFKKIATYYKDCLKKLRTTQSKVSWPIIISDGWWSKQWDDWVTNEGFQNDIIIDTHCYRCFSDTDKNTSVPQIVSNYKPFDTECTNDFIVGEFSCVLDGSSWSLSNVNREEWVKNYGLKQLECFNKSKNINGWFFWTYKFEYGDGGEWGLKPMMERGSIVGADKNIKSIDESLVDKFYNEHQNYWSQFPSKDYEHFRYKDGLQQSIQDIQQFHNFNGCKIGRINYWVRMRQSQYCQKENISTNHKSLWEYNQGYMKGLDEFN